MAEQFRATQTPQGVGSTQAIEEVGSHQQKANAWKQLFQVGTQAAQLATGMATQANADKAKQDTLEGYKAGVDMRISLTDSSPNDSFMAYDTTIGEISSGNSGASDAFNKGLLSAIKTSHASTGVQAKELQHTQYITNETSAYVIEQGDNLSVEGIKTFIKDTSGKTGISTSKVRDVGLATISSSIVDILAGVNDTDSLNAVKSSYGNLQTALNSDPQLFGTTTTGVGGEVVRKAKANITNAFSTAQTRINTTLDKERAQSDLDFNLLPKEYEDNLVKRYGRTSKELVTKRADYKENYDDNELTLALIGQGSGESGYDWVKLDRTKKGTKIAKEHVQAFQQNSLAGGDTSAYVTSVSNSPKQSEAVGTELTQQMNNFQTEEEGVFNFNKYGQILAEQDGPNALNISQGKSYKQSRLAFELWKSGATKSVTDARENASIAMSSNILANVSMKPGEKAYLAKKAALWGSESSEFRFLTNNIIALGTSPDDATDMVTKLYEDRRKEVGDITINGAPPKMLIGNDKLFSTSVGNQITKELKLEEGTYDPDDYTIKGSDDFSNTGLVYEKETGMFVATVDFEEAKDTSVDVNNLTKIAEDNMTIDKVKDFFDAQGNEFTNTIDRFIEDPTGSALTGLQGIGDFFLAAEGTSSRETISTGLDFIKREVKPQTREDRIAKGTQRLKSSIDKSGPDTVGPKELFNTIGSGITKIKEGVSVIINKFTPSEFRDGKVNNPQEVAVIEALNMSKVEENTNFVLQLEGVEDKLGQAGYEFEITDDAPKFTMDSLMDTIVGSETFGSSQPYNVLNGGEVFNDFNTHPGRVGKNGKSTAAGKYQFIKGTWDRLAKKYNLASFSPENQDFAAHQLAKDDYAKRTGRDLEEQLIKASEAKTTIEEKKILMEVGIHLNKTWSSLPGGVHPNSRTKSYLERFYKNIQ